MKLNIQDIKYIIQESTRKILTEITVQAAAQKYYQDIPSNDFMEIITTLQGGNNILQPETKWALGLYKHKSPRFMEDLYKLHSEDNMGYLDIFKRAKERRMLSGVQADLNKYKSISELGTFVASLPVEEIIGRTKGEMSNAVNAAANEAEFPYEDDTWKVVIPKTHEAACYWGKGTEWCTAVRDNDYYYDMYSEQDSLYININKQTGEKYQFHFPSNQFMDRYDRDIKKPVLGTIGASEGLIEFYENMCGGTNTLAFLRLMYEEFDSHENFVVFENDENDYLIIDTNTEEPICDVWVDSYNFDDGAIRLRINAGGAFKWIVWSGYHDMILPECMYDDIEEFDYDIAIVMQYSKEKKQYVKNYIDLEGELLLDEWVDSIKSWDSEIDVIRKDNKYKLYSKYSQKYLFDEWVDDIRYSDMDVLAEVILDDKFNLVSSGGLMIFPEFVDNYKEIEVFGQRNWYIPFEVNGKWNLALTNSSRRYVYSSIWFDDISYIEKGNYNEAILHVSINGEEHTLYLGSGFLYNDETREGIQVKN